jgi:hypothetical protein
MCQRDVFRFDDVPALCYMLCTAMPHTIPIAMQHRHLE